MYIAIAGNIGSGKTTLTEILTQRYGAKAYYEESDNPYIGDFYNDMNRWAFQLQISFLGSRIEQTLDMLANGGDVIIQDRTIYEDARIFAPNLHRQVFMSDRDFDNYRDLFDLMMSLVKMPDLMIYIRSTIPNLVAQIQKRGRAYESSMRIDYLQGLNDLYENWIADYKGKLLIIDGDTIKFGDKAEDFRYVTDRIDAELFGLFPFEGSAEHGKEIK